MGHKVYELIFFSIVLVFQFQILQKQFERMEERSVWLEAELLTIKAKNYELKTKLEAGTFNMNAENMELKSRLMQGKKQYVFFPKVFFEVALWDHRARMVKRIHFLGDKNDIIITKAMTVSVYVI